MAIDVGGLILDPGLQADFFFRLREFRHRYLKTALSRAVSDSSIRIIDEELRRFAPEPALHLLAQMGMRGELIFAVPCLLDHDPYLLGYYRLLLGFSQKEFYKPHHYGRFKSMEERGTVTAPVRAQLPLLCTGLCASAGLLISRIAPFSHEDIGDLQLLTLGPQMRGGQNNVYGQAATRQVFGLIQDLVAPFIMEMQSGSLRIRNTAGREISIRFGSDPDIVIYEHLDSYDRGLISIEIKGGTDLSNIHNRIGEAEKSHQKARANKFVEFMTIINLDYDHEVLKRESPTTNHFFNLGELLESGSLAFRQFRDLLYSVLSINASARRSS